MRGFTNLSMAIRHTIVVVLCFVAGVLVTMARTCMSREDLAQLEGREHD